MIGITSVTFRNKTIEEIISFSKTNDLDGIEWGGDVHVPPNDLARAQDVGIKTRQAGLHVFSYGSYYYLGSGMDILPVLDTAKALGTDRVRIWAGKVSSSLIHQETRQKMVQEAKTIAAVAGSYDMELCFEYHRGTLTDCSVSAKQLMEEINCKNVFLYWQPNPEIPENEKAEEIAQLKDYVRTIHCFYWTGLHTRHPLVEGRIFWERYLAAFEAKDIPILLEFCLDDSFENATEDIKILKGLTKKPLDTKSTLP